MRRYLVALFLSIFILQASGQQKWTLEDCIRYAVSNNLDIKESKLEFEKAEQNLRQSKHNLMPSIGASSSAGYSFGRTVVEGDLISESYFYNSYSVYASMDLFNGFSNQNRISYNKFKMEAAGNSAYNAADNLAFEVMNYFYDVIYYEELLKIATEQKALSQIIADKTEAYVKTGLKAMSDLLDVRADLEKEEFACIQAENKLSSTWISLRKSMNLKPDSAISLMRSPYIILEEDSTSLDISSLYQSHASWSPRIKSYEYDSKASKKYLSMQWAGFFPSLTTNASAGTYFYPTNENKDFSYQFNANQNQYAGISLDIPIFRKFENITNVKLAKLNYESSKNRLDKAKQDLLYEMITNYNDLKASLSEYNQALKQLEADTLSYRAAETKYDQGMINTVDLFTVKNRMASTTGQILHSGLTVEIKKRVIDFYRGNRFWEK